MAAENFFESPNGIVASGVVVAVAVFGELECDGKVSGCAAGNGSREIEMADVMSVVGFAAFFDERRHGHCEELGGFGGEHFGGLSWWFWWWLVVALFPFSKQGC